MKIVGWIRKGDKTACGGKVLDGLDTCTGRGIPYTFQTARIVCRNNCTIAEGFSRSTLSNGLSRVIHGMKTSGGCPLISTLNDIDGAGDESGVATSSGYIQDHVGRWIGNSAGISSSIQENYDEQFRLVGGDDRPLVNTYYTAKLPSGELFHGETDDQGRTQRFYARDMKHISIHIGHLER